MRKKIGLLWIAMLCFLPTAFAAQQAPIAVGFEDTATLISYDGDMLVELGTYDAIFALQEMSALQGDLPAQQNESGKTLYAAGKKGDNGEILYALIDDAGERLTEMEYTMLSLDGGSILFLKDGSYGALTTDGELLVEPKYTMLVSNGEGGFLATTTEYWDDEPDGVYWIDAAGNVSATGVKTMSGLEQFHQGLMPALSAENQMYGYLDAQGQWAIRPQLTSAGAFSGDYAVASLSTGYGLLDRTGNWVVTPKYEYLNYEAGGLILAQEDKKTVRVLDASTFEEKFTISGEELYCASLGERVQVYDTDRVQLYDAEGTLLNESGAFSGYAYGENGQTILYAGAWGEECVYLLDAQGKTVAGPFQSLSLLDMYEGTAYYSFMTFDTESTYSEELGENLYDWDEASVRNGVIDQEGRLVLSAEYEELYRLAENRLFARKGAREGVISLDGSWITAGKDKSSAFCGECAPSMGAHLRKQRDPVFQNAPERVSHGQFFHTFGGEQIALGDCLAVNFQNGPAYGVARLDRSGNAFPEIVAHGEMLVQANGGLKRLGRAHGDRTVQTAAHFGIHDELSLFQEGLHAVIFEAVIEQYRRGIKPGGAVEYTADQFHALPLGREDQAAPGAGGITGFSACRAFIGREQAVFVFQNATVCVAHPGNDLALGRSDGAKILQLQGLT